MDPRARKVVSYADISPTIPDEPSSSASTSAARPPIPKRPRPSSPLSSTPGAFTGRALNGSAPPQAKKQKRDPKSWQTSRNLTHDEIWDDSALVQAWDAAMEEYRAVNGEEKGWMREPTSKSALWWNAQPGEGEQDYEDDAEEEYAEADAKEVEEELATLPRATRSAPSAPPGNLPTIPFLPASSQALAALPDDPDKVLELAIQSYYWAGYLMGRRDEMVRTANGVHRGESLAEGGEGEDGEDGDELYIDEEGL
ncbi:hypothetical protein CALCODRAFT_482266 [Calocera cornea HHB12733]|uniref:Survival Motor Neuron Gemin2-binding domain-containing protein n=1 Tax=Calocera cornea HHB12733 TaxID=1353952 RepID=A0A165GUE4_9BASI|nr:hypothetical protein CALCODRAFT_482266 [Calocera cornea HHB12733]